MGMAVLPVGEKRDPGDRAQSAARRPPVAIGRARPPPQRTPVCLPSRPPAMGRATRRNSGGTPYLTSSRRKLGAFCCLPLGLVPGGKQIQRADGPQPLLQGSLHVAEGDGWIAGARPARRLVDEAVLVEGTLAPGVVEAVHVGVRQVPEGHAEPPVEPELEQGAIEAGGDEADVVAGEACLGGGGAV